MRWQLFQRQVDIAESAIFHGYSTYPRQFIILPNYGNREIEKDIFYPITVFSALRIKFYTIHKGLHELLLFRIGTFPVYLIKMKQKLIYTIGRNTALFKIKYLSSDFRYGLLHFVYRIILRIKAPL